VVQLVVQSGLSHIKEAAQSSQGRWAVNSWAHRLVDSQPEPCPTPQAPAAPADSHRPTWVPRPARRPLGPWALALTGIGTGTGTAGSSACTPVSSVPEARARKGGVCVYVCACDLPPRLSLRGQLERRSASQLLFSSSHHHRLCHLLSLSSGTLCHFNLRPKSAYHDNPSATTLRLLPYSHNLDPNNVASTTPDPSTLLRPSHVPAKSLCINILHSHLSFHSCSLDLVISAIALLSTCDSFERGSSVQPTGLKEAVVGHWR
jgi:hypothetical protein